MISVLSIRKQVTAKKPSPCIWCGEKIKVGDQYNSQAVVFDGDFSYNKYHPECYAAMLTDQEAEDGFDPFMFKRGTTEPA